MARALPERNATSPVSKENFTSSYPVAGPHHGHRIPCRLLQRAAELLSQGDLKGANATLKEAVRIMSPSGENDGALALLSTEEKRMKSRRTTSTGGRQT